MIHATTAVPLLLSAAHAMDYSRNESSWSSAISMLVLGCVLEILSNSGWTLLSYAAVAPAVFMYALGPIAETIYNEIFHST